MAITVKTLHTMSTIAPFSVISGNLYLMSGEQQFVQFWDCSDWLSREDTSSLALSIANVEKAAKVVVLCLLYTGTPLHCMFNYRVQLTSSLIF